MHSPRHRQQHRSRAGPLRVALATYAQLPDLDSETQALQSRLCDLGVEATPALWSSGTQDWSLFDLVVIRNCWDYIDVPEKFLAWVHRMPRLANPSGVVTWNIRKDYLRAMPSVCVPTVPTAWVMPSDSPILPTSGEWVLKPAVSNCALHTGRYDLGKEHERSLFTAHVKRLQASGHTAMIQPYLSKIDKEGEISLIFFCGEFSHAVRKEAVLRGPYDGSDRRFDSEDRTVDEVRPTQIQLEVARRALTVVPG